MEIDIVADATRWIGKPFNHLWRGSSVGQSVRLIIARSRVQVSLTPLDAQVNRCLVQQLIHGYPKISTIPRYQLPLILIKQLNKHILMIWSNQSEDGMVWSDDVLLAPI